MLCALVAVVTLPLFFATERDIPYVNQADAKKRLDLYLPDAKNFRTVVYIHEGGMTQGDKSDEPYSKIAETFNRAGFGFAAINYRLFPTVSWPAPAQDVASAFAWVKRNISAHGGDPSKVFILGHSSGATLAAVVSTDARFLAEQNLHLSDIAATAVLGSLLDDPDFASRFGERSKLEHAFVKNDFLKGFGTLERYQEFWPANHISKNMPRILLLIGDNETVNPPILASSERFKALSEKVGASVTIHVLPNRKHMEEMRLLINADDPTLKLILAFFN